MNPLATDHHCRLRVCSQPPPHSSHKSHRLPRAQPLSHATRDRANRRAKRGPPPPSAVAGDRGEPFDDANAGLDVARSSLEQLYAPRGITGQELWDLVKQKWGRSYDVRILKRGSRAYVQVMWKFLEQQSFPLTAEQYLEQLDAVASFLNEWGVADVVRKGVDGARDRGPGYTHGGGARAVSIPLDVDLGGLRSQEWV